MPPSFENSAGTLPDTRARSINEAGTTTAAQSVNTAAGRLSPLARWLGPYALLAEILLFLLAAFLLQRWVMLAYFVGPAQLSLSEFARVSWAALRFDLLTGLCILVPHALHLTFCSPRRLAGPVSRVWLEFGWLVALVFIPFVWVAELLFFEEFQSRLNYIAFEYLVYPTEICCNIWESYPIVPLLGLVAAVGVGSYLWLRRRFACYLTRPIPRRRRYGLLAGLSAAIGGLWLTTGMAANQVSTNRVVNECAGNGLYSFVYYAWTCRFDYGKFYRTIDQDLADEHVQRRVVSTTDRLHRDSPHPLDRTVTSSRPRRDYNVVLILEESLGSDFIGVLGDDRGLSPRFDELSREGLLFDNFYATGNRTARALEAVMTALPPIPTESILKRDHSDNVYSLAHVLAERGYERLFLTGGRGLFDGVRSFMTANGFNRFLEQKDYENPVFTNAWGVSDEDLFRRTVQELDGLHAAGRPFFVTVLTVSNHRPFTYPDGRIDRPSAEQSRTNAVKYADWALGDFFDQIRNRPYYDETIFVVMGDHGARVYGRQLFPMKSYRVPVLMILPEGERQGTRLSTLASALDIAPTILGLLGGSYRSVFFGRDVLSLAPQDGYALMQHNHDVALLEADGRMVVLGSRETAWSYQLDPDTFELKPLGVPDQQLMNDAISLYQTADRLYYSRLCFPAHPTPTKN